VLLIVAACTTKNDAKDAAPAPSASVAAAPPVSAAVPDVVSSASSVWDGGTPVVASGEVDGNALRAKNRARITGDKSAVTVLTGTKGSLDLGKRLCEAVVPQRPKETPILIKPNLGGFEWFKDPAKSGGDDGVHGRTTDVEFVRGIVRCLKARGHSKITIGEGFAHTHESWNKLVTVNGYAAMAKEESVKLVAFDDDGVFDVEGDQPGKPLKVKGMEKTNAPTLLMPKVLAEHLENGLFISAPKIKAHRFGVVTMAIKGMQGTVMLSDATPAFHQKWRMHKELNNALKLLASQKDGDKEAGKKAYLESLDVFSERMSDMLEVAAPHVTLAEGAPAMGGDGFGKRWPSDEDYAIGGTNPILVDRIGAQMLGLWDNADLAKELGGHKTSPLIETAAKRFGVDIAKPTVEGDGAALLATKRPVHLLGMSGFSLLSDDKPPEAFPGAPRGAIAREAHAAPGGEDALATAPAVTFDTDWAGKPTNVKTTVRFAWSKDALWMRWELESAGMNVDDSKPVDTERAKLYEEDCVELFLGQDPADRNKYWEIEVGPLGHFLDIAIDRTTKKSDVAWSSNSKITTKVDRDKKHVTIDVAVKSPDVLAVLKKGAKLPLGLYRMEGQKPGRQFLAWSPTRTAKPDFHVPNAFGVLMLD
jgi:uncharacterized protein (DUF362 family)